MPPKFRDPSWLLSHARECLEWYARDACIAPEGGLFHSYNDAGVVVDTSQRHLVSSTRLVVQFAWAIQRLTGDASGAARAPRYKELLHSCVAFLRKHHLGAACSDGYAWTLRAGDGGVVAEESTNYSYGLAFCLLAYANAAAAGVPEARAWADEVTETLTARIWEPAEGLYADEATPEWTVASYRGQNANMHACEAHMAAFKCLGQPRHLARARAIAAAMCVRQAERVRDACGVALVYEHYTADWAPDLLYNADKPDDRFKPWGFQPGHLLEWAKLILQLDELATEDDGRGAPETAAERAWRVPTARKFFAAALDGWDSTHGGFVYSLAPPLGAAAIAAAAAGAPLTVCNPRKYKWVQVSAIAS